MINEVEVLQEEEMRRAIMIKHPLTLRSMENRFEHVVTYRLSKDRFRDLFRSFIAEFGAKPGLIAGNWHTDHDGPSRALAWCGENGERVMMVCDGSADLDNSEITLGFANFRRLPNMVCKYWLPVQMKSLNGTNPWGVSVAKLELVETETPPEPEPKRSIWSRLFNW